MNSKKYKKYKDVKILNVFDTDYGDIKCNAILIFNGREIANIIASYEKIEFQGLLDNYTYDNQIIKERFKNLILEDYMQYIKLPKISKCSKLLQNIYDNVCCSDSAMCHIDNDDWKEMYADKYSKKDLENLVDEIEKYGLNEVIEVNTSKYNIVGYGDLETRFNDDRNLEKYIVNEKNDSTNSNGLKILSQCVDFFKLQDVFSDEVLQEIDNILEEYQSYQNLHDDGKRDIINEYSQKYGNRYVIDWYEGVMSTEDFVEEYLNNKFDSIEI